MKTSTAGFDAHRRQVLERTVSDATEFLLEQSNRTAPIEENVLIGSGTPTVEVSGDRYRGVVSYDTPYAVRQHEDTRLNHDPGRRAKWLERTAQEEATRLAGFLADGARKALA